MYVLGIESTCDETSFAVVKDGKTILSNIIASSEELQDQYGGVFPEMASRAHFDLLIPTLKKALIDASLNLESIDLIAVAYGPGLMGPLLMGLGAAKALSFCLNRPFIGVNHIKAHLYAAIMPHIETIEFPLLGVLLSGGHTALVKINSLESYNLLGNTVDDAIGEAFDKVSVMLELGYPGGAHIEALAKKGDAYKYSFKAGSVKNNPLDFSFSGLKTNVLYALKGQNLNKNSPNILSDEEKPHIAASFQRAAFSDVVNKTLLAFDQTEYKGIALGGGVCASNKLREMFKEAKPSLPLYWPEKELTKDNAAMIAGLGYHQYLKQKKSDPFTLKASPRIPF